jgi:hypothetical protein
LGFEDFKAHTSLMMHFIDSCGKVLNADGSIKITLVKGQELRWNVVEVANRLNFKLNKVEYFDEDKLKGFITKRNMHDKSFKNKHTQRHVRHAMPSFVYYFNRTCTLDQKDQLQLILDAFRLYDEQIKVGSCNEEQESTVKKEANSVLTDLKCKFCDNKCTVIEV